MSFPRFIVVAQSLLLLAGAWQVNSAAADEPAKPHVHMHHIHFDLISVNDGKWSNPRTWQPARVPKPGDRVRINRGTTVQYDVASKDVIRLVQVVGTLRFARDRDTELNVGILKVQASDECSESGFACDFAEVTPSGEPLAPQKVQRPTLEIGTLEAPIPAEYTARVRLHYLAGFDKQDAPALVCCSAKMEIHGAPMSRTWVELGADVQPGDSTVTLDEEVTGWRIGDEVILTGSKRSSGGPQRGDPDSVTTEQRTITKIAGRTLTLDRAVQNEHFGSGEFRSEVANLSRNVIVESAKPDGERGHTMYHAFSRGGISYARFAHLGKENVLGRYAIHYHLLGDSMRGSQLLGVAVVDSHNRWVTIHGTEYLIVRDCIGYQSVGHGFFMEDGTEVYNLLDRNLGVQAYRGKRLPNQVLPFDPNEGSAFWWANGRNTLVRNVSCENTEYGFRYDMQHSRYFNSTLAVTMADGQAREVDVRTIPIWRFEDNEAHTEGFYGLVVAANGNSQPDSGIQSERALEHIKKIDWTGPDTRHPHVIRNMTIWASHYAFRPHSPQMLMENVRIHQAAYGIYRPAFENQVYRNLHISAVGAEPFNRGMDDTSCQVGSISVDGLTFETGYGNNSTPLVQISDNNLSGTAATHLRNVTVHRPTQFQDRWPLINRGVGTRVPPMTKAGVPIYVHDHYGPGRHAKVVSMLAKDELSDGHDYAKSPPLAGDQALVAEVSNIEWPTLLEPIDDEPPATIITKVQEQGKQLHVQGVSHDNGTITAITVNGQLASITANDSGVVDWQITLTAPSDGKLIAAATDDSGNVEQAGHRRTVREWD